MFKLERYSDATLMQDIVASTTGAVWSLTLSSPADVIKVGERWSGCARICVCESFTVKHLPYLYTSIPS